MSARHDAIFELYSNVVTVCDSDGVLDADGKQVAVDEKKVKEKIAEIEAKEKLVEYRFDREMEYPSIKECIHALLDGGDTLKSLQDSRAAVKAKYPKPE